MKILHTSDWHLGHSLYGYDTIQDQRKMLAEIENLCLREKPDVFLLAGDIFDVARPGMVVQKMFVEAVFSLRRRLPEMAIVIVAGNHDSASLHEVYSLPWRELGVTIVGEASPDVYDMASRRVIIDDKCVVIPVPYFSERFTDEGYIADVVNAAVSDCEDSLPVILMLHTTISGSDFSGHDEDEKYVGGIAGVDVDSLGEGYDYVALGHIHKPQNVTDRIRYCGSGRMLSFDENYSHGVSVIEIEGRGMMPKVRHEELPTERTLVTIPAKGYAMIDELREQLSEMGPTVDFIRLNVCRGENVSPLQMAEFRKMVAEKGGSLCCINRETAEMSGKTVTTNLDLNEFKALSPLEVAERFYKSRGEDMSDAEREMFREIMNIVNEKDRE